MPLGRATAATLRMAAVMTLYLLRTVLAPASTLRGLRQIVLDAAPLPAMTRKQQAGGESFPDETDSRDSGQPVAGFRTKKAAFLSRYRNHPEYGNRSAAGRVADELAPLAGLQAGTGRTHIAEELRTITSLTTYRDPAGEDDDKSAK